MAGQYSKMMNEFKTYWQYYVFQSIAATVTIFVLLLVVSIQEKPVIVASIGASTFIVFAMPGYITAQPRNLVGGHLVGMSCGFLASLVPLQHLLPSSVALSLLYALAVGISIFIMVVIDTEHPPAAGTALGVAIAGFSVKILLTVLVSIIILSSVHCLFRHRLRDLT
ncbi:HPP family protein [Desulfonatronovibrio hydrogenovorans]|uniref:HPP family protein n=2 Tax=Desulfonatronovibrio hydrogenovorans TaxID=53245 RepID=UPI00048A51C1|nr:HPP family protein [Desulfonatronovibrio hydrogenovorans]